MLEFWSCVLVIGKVNDAPNQIRYQRVLALAKAYPLYVVTTSPLPDTLRGKVREVHVVGRWLSMWRTCLRLARFLSAKGDVVIHTVYAPRPMIAGFLCRALLSVRWIYDLYDHPSLTWAYERGVRRLWKRAVWHFWLTHMLRLADVWVIGMHPGILSHLPVPHRECRLVLIGGPGLPSTNFTSNPPASTNNHKFTFCYVGPLKIKRGTRLIAGWAERYEGPPACLHLIGNEDDDAVAAIEAVRDEARRRGLSIIRHGWIPHSNVMEILDEADIGLCPIDPMVLNYRYAYPVKIVEYMSHGVVPVATDGHGVRTLIHHGENGFVGRYDVESFSATITHAIRVCQTTDQRDILLSSIRESVDGRDWDTINHRFVSDVKTALDLIK